MNILSGDVRELIRLLHLAALCSVLGTSLASAGSGDPQVATDHPWYPGELACSTFERLQRTQVELYEQVVGRPPRTDEERVLAAWLWRNTHYWHGEEGKEDLWGRGFTGRGDLTTREYWTGLFAHGFSLCGTTHAQWTAEMRHLLGHNRARSVGVSGHNSFEVYLTGGEYGDGRWALLDHDLSTVLFDEDSQRLLSIGDIYRDPRRLTSIAQGGGRQHGWPVCGLHPDDGNAFDTFRTAEYLAGYAGPPPIVHLRRGETLRRYLRPGLEDGETFVFWGRNYNADGIPGPQRSRTWVNQPERMYAEQGNAGYRPGQARFANAVYTWRPDFANDDYREGIVDEGNNHVTFEFQSPYIIAATPPNDQPWGIYDDGCRNGLVITARLPLDLNVSVDRGTTWQSAHITDGRADLTDLVKGHRQYLLRVEQGASGLETADLKIVTVCQANSSVIPRLTDNGSHVRFAASGTALISAGPNVPQAEPHVVEGAFDSPRVTLELAPPRGAPAVAVYAAAHIHSSNPPSEEITYQMEFSVDGGETWQPMIEDWRITRRGEEPPDFWSQSFCWGEAALEEVTGPVRVRFHNDGGKRYARAELHLAYRLPRQDATRVTFRWRDSQGEQQAARILNDETDTWTVPTATDAETVWVEYEPVVAP
jgi:hypothetical protein